MSDLLRLAILLAQATDTLREQERGGLKVPPFMDRVDMSEDGWIDQLDVEATAAISGGVIRNDRAAKRKKQMVKQRGLGKPS